MIQDSTVGLINDQLRIKLLLVKATGFLATLLVLTSVYSVAMTPQSRRFTLYVPDMTCACIRTTKQAKTIIASETESGKSIYQIFKSMNGGQEVFRVWIGLIIDTERVKFWNYGVVDEQDFNGDGLPDYSWYGGDDSGQAMYLFLSHKNAYTRVDILKTLKAEWTRRFHSKAPYFENIADEYDIRTLVLERSGGKLVLAAIIYRIPQSAADLEKPSETISLRMEESVFKE
jgi:hypothetical protein